MGLVTPLFLLIRGVPVPKGTHRVRMEYRPPSLVIGATLSVVGVLAIVALLRRARR
jgi:uncharacterized membrane protein YfhO